MTTKRAAPVACVLLLWASAARAQEPVDAGPAAAEPDAGLEPLLLPDGGAAPAELTREQLDALSLEQLLQVDTRKLLSEQGLWEHGLTRNPVLELPAAVTSVDSEGIAARGALNITEALRGSPGIHVAMITASQPLIGIRGSNPFDAQRTALLVDGQPITLSFLGVKLYNQVTVPMFDIERIEVLRSPSVLYGADAVSGAINIISKRPTTTQVHGRLFLGDNLTRGGSVSGTAVFGESSWFRVSFDTLRLNQWGDKASIMGTGPDLGPAAASDADRTKLTVDDHSTFTAAVGTKLGSHAIEANVSLTSFSGYERFPDRLCEQPIIARAVMAALVDEVPLGEASVRTRLSFTQSNIDFVQATEFADTNPQFRPRSVSEYRGLLNSQLRTPLFKALDGELLAGIELDGLFTRDAQALAYNFGRAYGGIYAMQSLAPIERLRLFFGGRVDVGLGGQILPSPAVSGVVRISDHSSVRLSGSSAARAPNVYESGLELAWVTDKNAGKKGYYFGNPNLATERVSQAEVGYLWHSPRIHSEVNLFATYSEGLIEMVEITPQRIADRGLTGRAMSDLGAAYDPALPYLEYQNQAKGVTFGGEVAARVEVFTGLLLTGSYTWVQSQPEVVSDPAIVTRRASAIAGNAPVNAFSLGARYTLGFSPVKDSSFLKGLMVAVNFDWNDTTRAYVSGVLKTIPPWWVMTIAVRVPLHERVAVGFSAFNAVGSPHYEWPRHQVGQRLMGTLDINL